MTVAARLGWSPSEFRAATFYELTAWATADIEPRAQVDEAAMWEAALSGSGFGRQ